MLCCEVLDIRPKLLLNSYLVKSRSSITSVSIVQSIRNVAQSIAVVLSRSIQNFKTIEWQRIMLWVNESSRDLGVWWVSDGYPLYCNTHTHTHTHTHTPHTPSPPIYACSIDHFLYITHVYIVVNIHSSLKVEKETFSKTINLQTSIATLLTMRGIMCLVQLSLIYFYDITWCCIVHRCKFDIICFLTNRIYSQMLIMLWHYFVTIFVKQNIDWNAKETSLFRRGRKHVSNRFIHLE